MSHGLGSVSALERRIETTSACPFPDAHDRGVLLNEPVMLGLAPSLKSRLHGASLPRSAAHSKAELSLWRI